ncbi:hypothetical protein GX48_02044 [Paracoccidioides brasiliensis]|nr:hypothetical protein GX48_02044 [Paracoccidioides brasiliensis]
MATTSHSSHSSHPARFSHSALPSHNKKHPTAASIPASTSTSTTTPTSSDDNNNNNNNNNKNSSSPSPSSSSSKQEHELHWKPIGRPGISPATSHWQPQFNRKQSWNEQDMKHHMQQRLTGLEKGRESGFTEIEKEMM